MVIGAVFHEEGRRFDSWDGEFGHSVANGSPPLWCSVEAVLPRRHSAKMGPAIRFTPRRNRDYDEDLIFLLFASNVIS